MSHPFDITDYLTRPIGVGDRVVINDLTPVVPELADIHGTVLDLSPNNGFALVDWDRVAATGIVAVRMLAPVL